MVSVQFFSAEVAGELDILVTLSHISTHTRTLSHTSICFNEIFILTRFLSGLAEQLNGADTAALELLWAHWEKERH